MGIMINTVRFAVLPSAIRENDIIIDDAATIHQISHVLRLAPGAHIVVFDGSGFEYNAVIRSIDKKEIACGIETKRRGEREPLAKITLYFGLLKNDKNEWLVQKCSELGVAAFAPMTTERSIVRDLSSAKHTRLSAIAREATELSGGVHVPVIHDAISFDTALRSSAGTRIVAWEGETPTPLSACRGKSELSLFIGPEGGFTDAEIELAKQNNTSLVTLGRRILRAETAAVSAAASLLLP